MRNRIENIMMKEQVVVSGAEQLDKLIGLIHDEHFERDDIKYNKDQCVVEIPYRRIFHGGSGKVIRNILGIKTVEVEVIRSLLIIRNVEGYSFSDRARISTYSFNTISYKNNNLQFECNEDLDLNMVVSAIEIESRDIEIKGKSRITHGWFWESYTGKVR